jgi:hypothetical protein
VKPLLGHSLGALQDAFGRAQRARTLGWWHCVPTRVWIRKPRDACHTLATKPPATHAVQSEEASWILQGTAQNADRPRSHVLSALRDGGWSSLPVEQWHKDEPPIASDGP